MASGERRSPVVAEVSPTPASLCPLESLAVIIWAIGFFFEAVGDSHSP